VGQKGGGRLRKRTRDKKTDRDNQACSERIAEETKRSENNTLREQTIHSKPNLFNEPEFIIICVGNITQ
jgi:hypothetical protein